MPELPEVETIVRGLRPALPGRAVEHVQVLHPDVLRQPVDDFCAQLSGRVVEVVDRRGKNIVVHLTDGAILVVNLGMTGRLLLAHDSATATHPAVRFTLSPGPALIYDDVRRFGAVEVMDREEWAVRDGRLGPEPLSETFTARRLWKDLSRSISSTQHAD